MDHLFEIRLQLPPEGSRESARILYQQLRAAILEGRLATGARLPATRNAKAHFGVSRNTVAAVYERLLIEGYVVARRGSGTYVAAVSKPLEETKPHPSPRVDHRLNEFGRVPT